MQHIVCTKLDIYAFSMLLFVILFYYAFYLTMYLLFNADISTVFHNSKLCSKLFHSAKEIVFCHTLKLFSKQLFL